MATSGLLSYCDNDSGHKCTNYMAYAAIIMILILVSEFIEWLFHPSIRCSRHLEIIWDKLPKLLDRHPNRVTLFVWLGTWQCHTIVLSSSLTSVVRSLPLLYIYLLYIQTFWFHLPEILYLLTV